MARKIGLAEPVSRATARGARREQLLDTAAELVLEHGLLGFTMEGLAAAAGVSKALPYRHFANAEAALVALHDRELGRLAQRILDAVAAADPGDAMLRAAIAAYFDDVEERGDLLNVLAGAGSPLPEIAAGGLRPAPTYVAQLLTRAYGVRGRKALVLAALLAGLVTAGSDAVGRGDASRRTVERLTTDAAIGAVHATAGS